MKTIQLYTRNERIQQYHCICRNLGMSKEDKEALLSGWGVHSSTELTDRGLNDVLEHLRDLQDNRDESTNVWRRRVIAAAAAYLEYIGKFSSGDDREWRIQYIKGTACRMGQYKSFNKIPIGRLRNIYYSLVKAKKDRAIIDEMVNEIQIQLLTN